MLRQKYSDPTPEEIARMTEEFRRAWSGIEEQRRIVGRQCRRLGVRVIKTRALPMPIDYDEFQFDG